MSITESDYLRLQKDDIPYILLKGPEHYHLVQEDGALTESKLARLLRLYPCSLATMREMKLRVSQFETKNLRNVLHRGNKLELWVGGGVLKYTLAQNYTDGQLDTFFPNITHAPQSKRPELSEDPIRRFTWGLNGGAVALLLLQIFFSHWIFFYLSLLFHLFLIFLLDIYPQSFTLEGSLKGRKLPITHRGRGQLSLALILSGAAGLISTGWYAMSTPTMLLTLFISLCLYGLLLLPYLLFCIRNHSGVGTAVAAIFLMLLLSSSTLQYLNHSLDSSPPKGTAVEVVDTRHSRSRRSKRYSCTVRMPDGSEKTFRISGRDYEALEIGDYVLLVERSGGLGLPYSYLEIPEEDSI